MNQGESIDMRTADKAEDRAQISLRLAPDLHVEINTRAKETGLSMNRTIIQLLHSGLEAERYKKQRLEETLRRYRESADPQEMKRLSDELGSMIFGK